MIEKNYQPAEIEARMSLIWEDSRAFAAGRPDRRDAEPFTIVIPPPNVTGSLHMGHALNSTLQDVLCRFERMRGRDVLWQPGTDHAGIATQMVVERQLMERQQPGRRDMGREKFLERVWQWKAESGDVIINQLKRLGASCDWSRERFTMDEGLSRAVMKVFVELYRDGLIYKDKRLVNWDPKLLTAISDLEVQQVEVKGSLWYLRYPIEGKTFNPDDLASFIVVATTRPETMLGDTAVAVHPDDEHYTHLVGKHVILPLVGRKIPIVADEYSDPEKGSGAVKVTPAHDFNDFEIGRRHNLPQISVLNQEGALALVDNEDYLRGLPEDAMHFAEELHGVDRFAARKQILARLEDFGFLERVEPNTHMVPHGDRSGVVIEPYLTDQWYVDARCARAQPASCRRTGRRLTSSGWKTFSRGAFRANSGGAIRYRRGTAPMARYSSPKPKRKPSATRWAITSSRKSSRPSKGGRWHSIATSAPTLLPATRMCSTPGFPRRCGRSRPWAGPTIRRRSGATIRPTCW
jgi:valyl-tRNA synthetase